MRIVTGLAFACAAAALVRAEVDVRVPAGGQRAEARVVSLLELRDRNLVRQGWDVSRGAAALSTVLTHHYGADYSEATIAVSILANTDPESVRERGGFSLSAIRLSAISRCRSAASSASGRAVSVSSCSRPTASCRTGRRTRPCR